MISVLRQVYPATICRIIIRAIIPLQTTHTHKNTYAVKCPRDGGDWQLGSLVFFMFSTSHNTTPCINGLFLLGQSRDGDMKHKNNKINKGRENTQMLFVEMKCDWLRNGIRGAERVCCLLVVFFFSSKLWYFFCVFSITHSDLVYSISQTPLLSSLFIHSLTLTCLPSHCLIPSQLHFAFSQTSNLKTNSKHLNTYRDNYKVISNRFCLTNVVVQFVIVASAFRPFDVILVMPTMQRRDALLSDQWWSRCHMVNYWGSSNCTSPCFVQFSIIVLCFYCEKGFLINQLFKAE